MCEQCGRNPVTFPGVTGGTGRYCPECLDAKVNLIFDVHEVIKFFGVTGE